MSNKFLNTPGVTTTSSENINIPELTTTIRQAIFGENITEEELQNLNNYSEIVNANTNLLSSKVNLSDVSSSGFAEAGKILRVDVNKDINLGTGDITCTNITGTNITGTIQTPTQDNITSSHGGYLVKEGNDLYCKAMLFSGNSGPYKNNCQGTIIDHVPDTYGRLWCAKYDISGEITPFDLRIQATGGVTGCNTQIGDGSGFCDIQGTLKLNSLNVSSTATD